MARRRRIEGPSPEELQALEEGFAAKPAGNPFAVPPIAQVAGEAAAAHDPAPVETREAAAKDHRDAERLRAAEAEGRLAIEVPVAEIVADELSRDRLEIDREALEELKISIAAHGLRLPIEVFELSEPGEGERYGLISGYRRLLAVREIGGAEALIRVLVRQPKDAQDAFVAMVEENEVRSDLSHYERGRIAALTVIQGTFADVEEAVARLYFSASKAKRSKIRSFALIHEELGDMLSFPEKLTERAGLRLASALRAGAEEALRTALGQGGVASAEEEWGRMLPLVEASEGDGRQPPRKGGRPRKAPAMPRKGGEGYDLANGVRMTCDHDGKDYLIRLSGKTVGPELVEVVMNSVYHLLKKDAR